MTHTHTQALIKSYSRSVANEQCVYILFYAAAAATNEQT